MTRVKFDALTDASKAKACKVASFQELLVKASEEQARFHSCHFDIYTAMYRIHKQAIARPRKPKQSRPLYHTVTSNMLVRAMYDVTIPREEKIL